MHPHLLFLLCVGFAVATAAAQELSARNGERPEEIPLQIEGKTLSLAIDTQKLPKAGPTSFFEIIEVQ